MTILKAHFDGKVIVPDEPVDLPVGRPLEVRVESVEASKPSTSALGKLLAAAAEFPATGLPPDAAAQHDHYLYGSPKRESP